MQPTTPTRPNPCQQVGSKEPDHHMDVPAAKASKSVPAWSVDLTGSVGEQSSASSSSLAVLGRPLAPQMQQMPQDGGCGMFPFMMQPMPQMQQMPQVFQMANGNFPMTIPNDQMFPNTGQQNGMFPIMVNNMGQQADQGYGPAGRSSSNGPRPSPMMPFRTS